MLHGCVRLVRLVLSCSSTLFGVQTGVQEAGLVGDSALASVSSAKTVSQWHF